MYSMVGACSGGDAASVRQLMRDACRKLGLAWPERSQGCMENNISLAYQQAERAVHLRNSHATGVYAIQFAHDTEGRDRSQVGWRVQEPMPRASIRSTSG